MDKQPFCSSEAFCQYTISLLFNLKSPYDSIFSSSLCVYGHVLVFLQGTDENSELEDESHSRAVSGQHTSTMSNEESQPHIEPEQNADPSPKQQSISEVRNDPLWLDQMHLSCNLDARIVASYK